MLSKVTRRPDSNDMRTHLIILMLVFGCLLMPIWSDATPQTPDTVVYEDSALSWHGHGLAPVLKARGIELARVRTNAYDGHIARWEIRGNRLFLVGLHAWVKAEGLDGKRKIKEVGLEFFYPESKEVFAEWFSGEMVLLQSESKLNKDWVVETTYWHLIVGSGSVRKSNQVEETFDFHDEEQSRRYFTLFRKLPRR